MTRGLPLRCHQSLNSASWSSSVLDVIVPRGGKGLIERVSRDAKVPVIKHLDGICHVYVSAQADLDKAQRIAFNAKTYRYGICGAMETLLVDQAVAAQFLPAMADHFRAKGVELRGCERTRALIDVGREAQVLDAGAHLVLVVVGSFVADGESHAASR